MLLCQGSSRSLGSIHIYIWTIMFSTIVILKINKQHINIWSRYDLRRSFARSIKMPFKILHKRYKLGRILNRSRIDRGVSISAHRRTRETLLICKCNILKLILSVPILYIVVNCSWDHKSWNGLAGRRERRRPGLPCTYNRSQTIFIS